MIGVGIGIHAQARMGGPPTPASITTDWINRVVANGGTVSAGTQAAMLAFLTTLDGLGELPCILRMNMMVGSNLAAALTPVIVGNGLAVDVNSGFLETDYAEIGGSAGGLRGGPGRFLNTGIVFPAGHLGGFMVRSQLAGTTDCHFIGARSGTAYARLHKAGHPQTYSNFGLVTSTITPTAGQNAIGNWRATRKSPIVNRISKNNAATTIGTTFDDSPLPTQPVYVFAYNNDGVASGIAPTSYRFSGYWIDNGGISDGDEAALQTAINTFVSAVGR